MRDENEKATQAASNMAGMPSQGCAGRQSVKSMLLAKAESMRREATQLETLAYATDSIRGDADEMLYRLLSAHIFR